MSFASLQGFVTFTSLLLLEENRYKTAAAVPVANGVQRILEKVKKTN